MHIGWGVSMEQEEKKIYTIEDITRELGVSKTTVPGLFPEKDESDERQGAGFSVYRRT